MRRRGSAGLRGWRRRRKWQFRPGCFFAAQFDERVCNFRVPPVRGPRVVPEFGLRAAARRLMRARRAGGSGRSMGISAARPDPRGCPHPQVRPAPGRASRARAQGRGGGASRSRDTWRAAKLWRGARRCEAIDRRRMPRDRAGPWRIGARDAFDLQQVADLRSCPSVASGARARWDRAVSMRANPRFFAGRGFSGARMGEGGPDFVSPPSGSPAGPQSWEFERRRAAVQGRRAWCAGAAASTGRGGPTTGARARVAAVRGSTGHRAPS